MIQKCYEWFVWFGQGYTSLVWWLFGALWLVFDYGSKCVCAWLLTRWWVKDKPEEGDGEAESEGGGDGQEVEAGRQVVGGVPSDSVGPSKAAYR